jgi:hypothetical protein
VEALRATAALTHASGSTSATSGTAR